MRAESAGKAGAKAVVLHSVALAFCNVTGLSAGFILEPWLRPVNSIVSQFPVATVLSVLGFALWYHGAVAISSGRWSLGSFAAWLRVYWLSFVTGPLAFVPVYYFSRKQVVSFEVLGALWAFQFFVNILATAIFYPQRSFFVEKQLSTFLRHAWLKRVVALFVGSIFCLVLLGLLEGIFYLLNSHRSDLPAKVFKGGYPGNYYQDDALLGLKLRPATSVPCRLEVGGKPVWDVTYSSDEYGRRKTPIAEAGGTRDFALFMGCSFAFGEGVQDDETLPASFGKLAPAYQPYNYGVPGYGPQQMLAKLESHSLREEIHGEHGMLIYLYLEDIHEARVIGDMQSVNAWAAHFPFYECAEGADRIHRKGSFVTGRPWRTLFYYLLGKSQTLRFFRVNLPTKLTDSDYRLTAKMLSESRRLFEAQFHSTDFYVVIYPKPGAHKKIIPYLEQSGVKYLDYSDLFDPSAEGYSFKGDGHPTPLAYRVLAEQLAKDIGRLREKTSINNLPPDSDGRFTTAAPFESAGGLAN